MKRDDKGARGGRDLHVHSVPTIAEQARISVEIIAIVAAGLWALYTFVYEQRIKPLSEPASFSLPTAVDQSSTAGGVAFLTIHKRVVNTGNVPIDLAAEALSVYGERLVPGSKGYDRVESPTSVKVSADVPRKAVTLLYSFAKLRAGAVNGNPNTNFFVPPHSSAEENVLVAVPIKKYPVVLIERNDYVEKAPISPKIAVKFVKTPLGAYDLSSSDHTGQFDSRVEYPIRPR